MRKVLQGTLVLGAILLSLTFTSQANASTYYEIIDLGSLGGTESFAYALNDHGQVYGLSRLPGDKASHNFVYDNGAMTDLNLTNPNLLTVWPTTITNSGLVSTAVRSGGIASAAIFDTHTGQTTVLGSLGGVTSFGFSSTATSVNSDGEAVGMAMVNSTNYHAFLYSGGVMTDIGTLGGTVSEATSINDAGMIAGHASTDGTSQTHAFLYNGGVMTDINPFGSSQSYGRDINNQGQVIG